MEPRIFCCCIWKLRQQLSEACKKYSLHHRCLSYSLPALISLNAACPYLVAAYSHPVASFCSFPPKSSKLQEAMQWGSISCSAVAHCCSSSARAAVTGLANLFRQLTCLPTGTNFLTRATAFQQAGWSPEYTLTEDFALGMVLKKHKWHCRSAFD